MASIGGDIVSFMRDLEGRYRLATGLPDRSQYRIFYGPVRPVEMLVLGINPGGDPAEVMPDGVGSRVGGKPHSASAGYHENDESDVLDCDWPENRGLLKLLLPLVGGDREALRARMVKTNLAFRRSAKAHHIDLPSAKAEAAPFLMEIIGRVRPTLVLLTGVKLDDFTRRFCNKVEPIGDAVKDPGVKQTVWRAARVELRATGTTAALVQVAHASQFGWTYERYGVAERIRSLLGLPTLGTSSEDAAEEPKPVATSTVVEGDLPKLADRPTGREGVAGMNVAAYEALFRKLGFTAYESHKKLQHPELPITLYFNRDRAGFVWFAVRAKDFDAYKPTLWEIIPPPQKKDAKEGIRTVVPKSGCEEAAFRDLLEK